MRIGVRELVCRMEQSVIKLLRQFNIEAAARSDAPGVYVNGAKIAALGLKIKHGRCYHGLSLNVAMDLRPFQAINPCGYPGLEVTDMQQVSVQMNQQEVAEQLIELLAHELGFQEIIDAGEQLPSQK